MRSLGADVVVRRGDDVAANIRAEIPEGVDGLVDGSVQAEQGLPAVKDGGVIGSIRGWSGDLERGITVKPVLVYDSVERGDLVKGLEQQLADGVYTLRVAKVLPAEQAEEAHRLLEAGGVRGRLVLDFSSCQVDGASLPGQPARDPLSTRRTAAARSSVKGRSARSSSSTAAATSYTWRTGVSGQPCGIHPQRAHGGDELAAEHDRRELDHLLAGPHGLGREARVLLEAERDRRVAGGDRAW